MEETEATQQLIRPSTEDEEDFDMKHRSLRKRRQNKTKSNLEGPKGLFEWQLFLCVSIKYLHGTLPLIVHNSVPDVQILIFIDMCKWSFRPLLSNHTFCSIQFLADSEDLDQTAQIIISLLY